MRRIGATPRKNERAVQRQILDALKKMGVWHYKVVVANVNGIPDIACIIDGKPVYIEVKRDERAVLSPLQEYQAQKIKEAGGYFYRVDNLDQLSAIFREHGLYD